MKGCKGLERTRCRTRKKRVLDIKPIYCNAVKFGFLGGGLRTADLTSIKGGRGKTMVLRGSLREFYRNGMANRAVAGMRWLPRWGTGSREGGGVALEVNTRQGEETDAEIKR